MLSRNTTISSDMENCPFCDIKNYKDNIVCETELTISILDRYPVSKGHTLVIPKRHVGSYFDLTEDEVTDIWSMVNDVKKVLDYMYEPDGYNIGINVGKAAGQTVPHVHIHVIPRYLGDMEDPKGGIRGVIPDKQKY